MTVPLTVRVERRGQYARWVLELEGETISEVVYTGLAATNTSRTTATRELLARAVEEARPEGIPDGSGYAGG
jgi:hypothetical protein